MVEELVDVAISERNRQSRELLRIGTAILAHLVVWQRSMYSGRRYQLSQTLVTWLLFGTSLLRRDRRLTTCRTSGTANQNKVELGGVECQTESLKLSLDLEAEDSTELCQRWSCG